MNHLKRIYELFNTKNYSWIKDYSIGKKAKFTINNDDYFVCFDEICTNVYNHYFYLEKDNIKYFDIIEKKDNRAFQVFSNVKHILDDFLKNNEYVEFIGFSSSEKERSDLYILYSQYIRGRNDLNKFISTNVNKVDYYIIYDNKIGDILVDFYMKKFIKENIENKK